MPSPRRRGRRIRKSVRERLCAWLGYDLLWSALAVLVVVVITAPQIRLPEPEYQPDDIALADVTAPHFGHLMEIQLKLLFLAQDFKSFGVGLHQSVLDTFVHHLDEVPRTTLPHVAPTLI